MHCVDVIRELSAPTAECDPAALAEHLAGCPRCASWAEQSARLDALWEATRPAEPSADAWDRMWANITAALDRPAAPVAAPPRPAEPAPRPWRRSVLAAFTVAQAAAILAAFTLAWHESGRRQPAGPGPGPGSGPAPVVVAAAPAAPARIEIEPAQPVRISFDGDRVDVHVLAQAGAPNAVDDNFLMFNGAEAMAGAAWQ